MQGYIRARPARGGPEGSVLRPVPTEGLSRMGHRRERPTSGFARSLFSGALATRSAIFYLPGAHAIRRNCRCGLLPLQAAMTPVTIELANRLSTIQDAFARGTFRTAV